MSMTATGYQYAGTPWTAVSGEIVGAHKCQRCDYIIQRGQHTICGPCTQRLGPIG